MGPFSCVSFENSTLCLSGRKSLFSSLAPIKRILSLVQFRRIFFLFLPPQCRRKFSLLTIYNHRLSHSPILEARPPSLSSLYPHLILSVQTQFEVPRREWTLCFSWCSGHLWRLITQSRVPAIHLSLQAKGSFPGGWGICFQEQGGKSLPRNKELRARRLSQPLRRLKNPSFWAEGPH